MEQVAVNHKVGGSNPLSGAKRTCFRQVFFNALWLHAKHAFATGKQQPPVAERLRNDEVGLNRQNETKGPTQFFLLKLSIDNCGKVLYNLTT